MRKKNLNELLRSIRQVGEIMRGERMPAGVFQYKSMKVKEIRGRLGLTQTDFAKMICVSVATVRNWEQGRTYPEGAAIALLRVAEAKPEAILEALHAA